MDIEKPNFADSEWVIFEPGNWRLKPGAPKSIQEEFIKFMDKLGKGSSTPEVFILPDPTE